MIHYCGWDPDLFCYRDQIRDAAIAGALEADRGRVLQHRIKQAEERGGLVSFDLQRRCDIGEEEQEPGP